MTGRGWIAAAGLAAALAGSGCSPQNATPPHAGLGDPRRGAVLIGREACGSCHVIPGVSDARGQVGPPLTHFARRTIVAGLLPNTPANLTHWIRDPQSVTRGDAMPNSPLSDAEARDVAAYLYTLR